MMQDNKELVPWLMVMLEEYSGMVLHGKDAPIQWTNKERGEFLIRWPRTSKRDVHNPNSELFVKYATRGLCDSSSQESETKTKTDPQVASIGKRNLRSALHKSDVVEELSDQRQGASTSQPWRVYRFTTTKPTRKRPPPSSSPAALSPAVKHALADSTTRSPVGADGGSLIPDLPQFHTVSGEAGHTVAKKEPATEKEDWTIVGGAGASVEAGSYVMVSTCEDPSVRGEFETEEYLASPSTTDESASPMAQSSQVSSTYTSMDTASLAVLSDVASQMEPHATPDEAGGSFWVVVRYCGQTAVLKQFSQGSCHISHQPTEPLRMALSEVEDRNTFGDRLDPQENLPGFYIPAGSRMSGSPEEEQTTAVHNGSRILKEIYRGLKFECINGDIFATRYCKCGVIYVSQKTRGVQMKLERVKKSSSAESVRTKIFDYNYFYKNKLEEHFTNKCGPEPHPFVYLSFGQKFCSNLHVDMVITSHDALQSLADYDPERTIIDMNDLADCKMAEYTSLIKSRTDTFDKHAQLIQGVVDDLKHVDINSQPGGGHSEEQPMDMSLETENAVSKS